MGGDSGGGVDNDDGGGAYVAGDEYGAAYRLYGGICDVGDGVNADGGVFCYCGGGVDDGGGDGGSVFWDFPPSHLLLCSQWHVS